MIIKYYNMMMKSIHCSEKPLDSILPKQDPGTLFIEKITHKSLTKDIDSIYKNQYDLNVNLPAYTPKLIKILQSYSIITLLVKIFALNKIFYIPVIMIFYKFCKIDNKTDGEKITPLTKLELFKSWGLFSILCILFFIMCVAYKYIQTKITANEHIIKYGLPINYIHPKKLPKENAEDILILMRKRLKLNEKLENEILMKIMNFKENHKKGNHSGMLLIGHQGIGKTEIANLLCQICDGGYLVHLGTIAMMGTQGLSIFQNIIDICIKENKILFLDDGELMLQSRDKIIFDDDINENLDIEVKTQVDLNKTKKILLGLINTIIAQTGSKTLSFIITSNFVYGLQFDDAIKRRINLFITMDYNNSDIDRLEIIKSYINLYKLNIIGIHFDDLYKELVEILNHLSGRDIKLFFKFLQISNNNNNIIHINSIRKMQQERYPRRGNIRQKISQINKEYYEQYENKIK